VPALTAYIMSWDNSLSPGPDPVRLGKNQRIHALLGDGDYGWKENRYDPVRSDLADTLAAPEEVISSFPE